MIGKKKIPNKKNHTHNCKKEALVNVQYLGDLYLQTVKHQISDIHHQLASVFSCALMVFRYVSSGQMILKISIVFFQASPDS